MLGYLLASVAQTLIIHAEKPEILSDKPWFHKESKIASTGFCDSVEFFVKLAKILPPLEPRGFTCNPSPSGSHRRHSLSGSVAPQGRRFLQILSRHFGEQLFDRIAIADAIDARIVFENNPMLQHRHRDRLDIFEAGIQTTVE